MIFGCNDPKVSVIMPINKDDGFFDDAINSILSQTYRDFELLIIANGCVDELWEKISTIKDARVISKRLNVGNLIFPMNVGLSIARGKYIARMDADDIALPNRLKIQYDFMEKNRHVDILGGRVKLIDSKNIELDKKLKFSEKHAEIISLLPYRNPLVHPTIFFRKNVVINSGGYKFGFTGEDYELWIRLMLEKKIFHNLNEEVLMYRRHDAQMTNEQRSLTTLHDVSGMLFMYFMKTGNYKFLLGMLTKIPLLRKIRKISGVTS
jgi:glycosyltransferase involved in cell wall biosynthesis